MRTFSEFAMYVSFLEAVAWWFFADAALKGNVRSSKARDELSPHLIGLLTQREQFDLELYDFATRLFLEQLHTWAHSSASPMHGGVPRSLFDSRPLIDGAYTASWMEWLRSNDLTRSQYRSAIAPMLMDAPATVAP